jgi:hypothetical protein
MKRFRSLLASKIGLAQVAVFLAFAGNAGVAQAQSIQFKDSSIVVGQSTPSDIESLFGKPRITAPDQRNGEKIEIFGYNHTELTAAASKRITTAPVRQGIFTFFEGKVVGKTFFSSFAADSTGFDIAKAATVTAGMSKQQVIDLLGPSAGEGVYPVAKVRGHRVLLYNFSWAKGRAQLSERATIELNQGDQVVDVKIEAPEK